ncbi:MULTISPECIES: phage tail tube protein [unclassified Streptomyces]|uniref:phage tail tube protein n=1 Tax=unclassified Streptomyces TaxID=2593676 RepID=UPI002271319F|nr:MULTISPECIES: phage tail tube protein [unclassified Streptomyces]MCY0919603.1 phage tail tube protein [Streptomyces sp. H27-G5]MCY0957215.1 phage tail tube protein [Streptomyces sp. H27-H5]
MAGQNAFGTQFKRGDGGSPETFTALAEVTNISGPGLSRETIDVTSHSSPDAWMEFVGGLKDGGEVSIDVNYAPSMHDSLVDDFDDVDPRNYQVVFPDPDTTTWSIKAVMTGFESEAPYDDKLAATITFKVSGKPTIS